MTTIRTADAELEVDDRGPEDAPVVVLLHGFPDVPATWDDVVVRLPAGLRIVRPALRGVAGSRSLPGAASGQTAALAADVLGLLEALDLRDVVLVGHDWGARAAHAAAALDPSRLRGLVTISTAYGPRTSLTPQEALADVAAAWYRWWLCTTAGEAAFRADPAALVEWAWREWSPGLQLGDAERHRLLEAMRNEQFADTVVHYYRHGAGEAPGADRYADAQARLDTWPVIEVPTTFLLGSEDGCETVPPARAAAPWFPGGYEPRILPGVGHFVQRQAPEAVVAAIAEHLAR